MAAATRTLRDSLRMASKYFVEIQIPQQKYFDSLPLPAVLSPNTSCSIHARFVESIKAEKPYLESLFHRTGAVLFRGFPVDTAQDFNDVVEAFGFEEFTYTGAAPRTRVVGRVFTANEAPPELEIKFHHEMAQFEEFPGKLFFFCEVEPQYKGETPIVLSHVVYQKMKNKYPDFVKRLEEHEIIYSLGLADEDDPSVHYGRGWKSTFSTNDKSVAQQRALKYGMRLEWQDEGVKLVVGPVPAIRCDDERNRTTWFNSMAPVYSNVENQKDDQLKSVTFGDGEPLPSEAMEGCLKILEEESVAFPWQKGDILFLDNRAVLHARRMCHPPRRILVSLTK